MTALAGDKAGAEKSHPGKEVGHQLLRPGGRVLQDVAGEYLPAGQDDHGKKADACKSV